MMQRHHQFFHPTRIKLIHRFYRFLARVQRLPQPPKARPSPTTRDTRRRRENNDSSTRSSTVPKGRRNIFLFLFPRRKNKNTISRPQDQGISHLGKISPFPFRHRSIGIRSTQRHGQPPNDGNDDDKIINIISDDDNNNDIVVTRKTRRG